jgi:hypothetical protein
MKPRATLFDAESARRMVRIALLLDAADRAGLSPIRLTRLHAVAYLSNVLAPVWDLWPLDGKLLKRRGGPFYPDFQRDLDQLVGKGLVLISQVSHVLDEDEHWRLEGAYRLNEEFSGRIIDRLDSFEEEHRTATFIRELLFAVSTMPDGEFDLAVSQDATYMDRANDVGSVIDFNEWRHLNYSLNAAQRFANFTSARQFTTAGEKLHLYIAHIKRRLEHADAQ